MVSPYIFSSKSDDLIVLSDLFLAVVTTPAASPPCNLPTDRFPGALYKSAAKNV